jgi:hypothetical protein
VEIMGAKQSKSNEPLVFVGTPEVDKFEMHISERLAKTFAEGPITNSTLPSTPKKPGIVRSPGEKLSLGREQAETEGLMRRLDEISRQLPSLEKALTLFKDPTAKGYCAQELEVVMNCYEQNPKRTLYCHDYVQELQQCVKRVRESVLAS